ncbi:ATP-binding protein [Hyphomonas johnsonii]|uniref:histidine kinase n=1 Tax=Hyphomonas johnsonii MHS-2 TaxID=1280950 RepID=A0A059FSX2_9PROT|nr:ATP-binding protein [Hyphomonas johnsonii]KCZ93779.1 sensor histidine kinase [Hyphomonas johnsonii MHS-2]
MDAPANPVTRFADRWSSVSLARRIMIAAAIWGLVVLVGGSLALSALYRAQTLALLEEDLDQTLVSLSRDLVREQAFLPDGRVTDTERDLLSGDTRFQTQYSGQYWAVVGLTEDGRVAGDFRSKSLWDEPVPLTEEQIHAAVAGPGTTRFADFDGPADQRVRVAAKAILVEGRTTPLILMAAADRTPNDAAATRFRNMLLGTMIALFGSVFAAMVLAIRFSLRPLKRIGQDIAEIREGTRATLQQDYPLEVRPLTEELNKLIGHNRDVVERAKTHVGNLAHALKTPIAVLRNEAKGGTQLDDVVRRQTESMHANVEHYLKRARMVARAEALGARTEVTPVVEALARLLNRLFDAKGINVSVEDGAGAVFRGEQQDLEEMIGNLMDNACKWAAAEVVVRVTDTPAALEIDVEDDGPGLSPEEREGALKRGVRLDETTPGTGLGLSIVTELAELHKGSLDLDNSPMGGLRARLRFPKS